MVLRLVPTSQFKKDLKRIKKRGYDMAALQGVLDRLMHGDELDERNRDHALTGGYIGSGSAISNPTGCWSTR